MAVPSFDDDSYLESVFAGTFAFLKGVTFVDPAVGEPTGFEKSLRAIVAPDSVPVADQPAFIFVQGPIDVSQKNFYGPSRWQLTAVVFIYFRADGVSPSEQGIVPAQLGNNIIWAISKLLKATPASERQTLGGLVHHCWIEGIIHTNFIEQQMLLEIPLHILI